MSLKQRRTKLDLGIGRNGAGALVLFALAASIGCHSPNTRSTPAPHADQHSAVCDIVIVNAEVWTGVEGDTIQGDLAPTAVAIRGNRIIAVGSDATIRAFIGDATQVIDAEGRRVIPGLTDCHTHIIGGGFQLARLSLRDADGREAFVQAIAAEAGKKRKGQWVLGGRWSVESWEDPQTPNRSWIDPVTGDTPVLLSRMDGHSALANSAALKLAGIDASGPDDPKGGEIQRDPQTGEPTGILKESAMGLVRRLIPSVTSAQRYEALLRAMLHANSLGITAVHDMSSRTSLPVFRRAEELDHLTVRITAYLSVSDWAAHADRVPTYNLDSDWVRLAGLKGFMDGSLGSRTAYMHDPFADATDDTPYPRGQLTDMADPPEKFQQNTALADSHGLQLAVHSIGDEANHLLLDAYEYAAKRNGSRNAQHRVEHTQHLQVADIPRFAELGVIASMQPFHKADDGRYCEKALGQERLAGSYAFRQLVDSGALVVFGSDWPVVTLNPFAGIDSAVNARTLAGNVWLPSHSLTVEEALRCYTASAARAIHRDDRLGTLEPGKLADLVILSNDLLTMPKESIGTVQADMTIVDGKIVFVR